MTKDAPENTPEETMDDWLGKPEKSFVPWQKPPEKPASKPPRKAPKRPPADAPANAGGRPTRDQLRDELENAPEAPPLDADPRDDAGSGPAGRDQGAPSAGPPPGGRRTRKRGEIFDNCPVKAVGVRGDYHYFLDVHGQLRAFKDLKRENVKSLFAHMLPALFRGFPEWRMDKDTDTLVRKEGCFDHNACGNAMYAAAGECGLINPMNVVRGVGAWSDDDGNLVYHLGDKVMVNGELKAPGRHGGFIYPAQPPIPHPADDPDPRDPAPEMLETLQTWNWDDPDLHPFLALGLIGCQMFGGALDWRPVFWLLASPASGKSAFHDLLKHIHGLDGLVQSTDATKSGITSKLGQSSLPVAIDELEPGDERSTRERDIITLARVAASGGEWFRGSADQSGVGGKVYSTFVFSSILIPQMRVQDVQRLIRIGLKPIEPGTPKPNLRPRTWRDRGRRFKAQMIARWPTWHRRLDLWRDTLERAEVTGRDADNWGTVLAMADMALNEALPDPDTADAWARRAALALNAGRDETVNDADAMLLHLMGQPFDIYRRGEHFTVAQWIMAAAVLPGAPQNLLTDAIADRFEQNKLHNAKLAKAGLRVVGTGPEAVLFIANKRIPGLLELFKGTDWAGGVWQQSAGRVPGAEAYPKPRTLAGIGTRGVQIPLKSIPGITSAPAEVSGQTTPTGDAISEQDFA